jgi:hypothetical protein
VVERDDGFRRLDEASALDVRARRETEQLARNEPADLAPRGVGAILDDGIAALRARFLPCFGACAVVWLVPAWIAAYWPPEEVAARFEGAPELAAVATLGVQLVNMGLQAAVQVFATLLVGVILRSEFHGEPLPLGAALGLVARRILPGGVSTLLVALLSVVGIVLCFLPYFWVLWRFSLGPLCTALENDGPVEALSRSLRLTAGSFARWLGVFIVSGAISALLSGVAGAASIEEVRAYALAEHAVPAWLYALLLWIASTLFFALATALTAAVTTSFFFDCRARRGGLDLALRLDALAAGRPASAAA